MAESTLRIENVVASTQLADEFNLEQIDKKLENTEYDKGKFPGLVYRVRQRESTM